MKTIFSKYAGTCTYCQKSIAKGELIAWSRSSGAQHAKCAGVYIPESPQNVRAKCWSCGSPEGRFRPQGAATPVYCDTCEARNQAAKPAAMQARSAAPDYTDLAYEDSCAAACGIGL